jgi:hypothetical protein
MEFVYQQGQISPGGSISQAKFESRAGKDDMEYLQ